MLAQASNEVEFDYACGALAGGSLYMVRRCQECFFAHVLRGCDLPSMVRIEIVSFTNLTSDWFRINLACHIALA